MACATLGGMHKRALFLLSFVLAVPAAAAAEALGADTQELRLQHAGLARRALVHVPVGLDPKRPVPLVLAFHGGGGHAEFMADDARYGWIGQADRAGFVVVFPNGFSRFPGGRLATWNAGDCCGAARDQGSDDVGFVRALLERLKQQWPIDGQRIFATGMSNGSMFSYRLACEMADTFRAVAAVAGTETQADAACQPARPVPVLHIHARNDSHVQFDGGAGPDAFRDRKQVTDYLSVPETVARWVRRNRSQTEPERDLGRPGASCLTHAATAADSAPVRLCVTDAGGHSWPGARRGRLTKEPPSQALVAQEEIWRFFVEASQHPR